GDIIALNHHAGVKAGDERVSLVEDETGGVRRIEHSPALVIGSHPEHIAKVVKSRGARTGYNAFEIGADDDADCDRYHQIGGENVKAGGTLVHQIAVDREKRRHEKSSSSASTRDAACV